MLDALYLAWDPTDACHLRTCCAAALRAVVEHLGESRAPGLEPEHLYGYIVDAEDLLTLAAELENNG